MEQTQASSISKDNPLTGQIDSVPNSGTIAKEKDALSAPAWGRQCLQTFGTEFLRRYERSRAPKRLQLTDALFLHLVFSRSPRATHFTIRLSEYFGKSR